jgi:predicted cupin superfamily sugar epimerase
MRKQEVISSLQLEPHIEGGYFRRTYCSAQRIDTDARPRALMTSIFYLLTDDAPCGRLHRNRSDILHFWHAGGAMRYWLIDPEGTLHNVDLGPDLAAGEQLQLLVPGGWWKASELLRGEFGLLSEAVSPGFDFADMTLADRDLLATTYPQHAGRLDRFFPPARGGDAPDA